MVAKFLEYWPVISFFLIIAIGIAGFAMRKSFVSHELMSPLVFRLQTIEQTYAKDRELTALNLRVHQMEEAIKNLPDNDLLTQTQVQLARVEEQCRHLNETINRIERPLQLMLEANLNRRSND
jgi:hypothetical protein